MERIPRSTGIRTLGQKKSKLARIKLVRIRRPRPPRQLDEPKQVASRSHSS